MAPPRHSCAQEQYSGIYLMMMEGYMKSFFPTHCTHQTQTPGCSHHNTGHKQERKVEEQSAPHTMMPSYYNGIMERTRKQYQLQTNPEM
jgi:hypothetical protein